MNRISRSTAIALALALAFLVGPFFVVFIAGFSGEDTLVFPPRSLSWRWVVHVFTEESFATSFQTSLIVAVVSTAAALLLGVPAAYALVRRSFAGQEFIRTVLTLPVIVPGIIVGLALLNHMALVYDLPVTASLLLGHTALLLPYTVRVVSGSLNNLRVDIEEAAVTLGATRLGAFRLVVLPNIRGGLISATVLAFITSFNQVPVSLFLTGPGISTLPIEMLAYMETHYDPSIAALSTLMVVFTIALVALMERWFGFTKHV